MGGHECPEEMALGAGVDSPGGMGTCGREVGVRWPQALQKASTPVPESGCVVAEVPAVLSRPSCCAHLCPGLSL